VNLIRNGVLTAKGILGSIGIPKEHLVSGSVNAVLIPGVEEEVIDDRRD
jgi:hypothetical protein